MQYGTVWACLPGPCLGSSSFGSSPIPGPLHRLIEKILHGRVTRCFPLLTPRDVALEFWSFVLSMSLAGVSLLPAALGVAGTVYVTGAAILGIVFIGYAIRYGRQRTRKPAIRLMAASLFYMPLILTLLLVDRRIV